MGYLRDGLASVGRTVRRVRRTVGADLRADPALQWVLLLAAVTTSAFVWYRLPNFAAPDEYARLLKPMKVAGHGATDGLAGIRRGFLADRALGPTFYLNALALAPVFLLVVLSGNVGQFTSLGSITSRWTLWHAAPAWFWSAGILLARLFSVAAAIAAVYVVYRTATAMYDRRAGRYSALALALSLAFVSASHEAAEDAPLVLLVSLVVYLSYRYVRQGQDRELLVACALGGLATALKFSGGITALVVASALVLRVRETGPRSVLRPRLLGGGLLVALAAFYVGFPAAVVGGPGVLIDRVANEVSRHVTGSGPGEIETAPPFFGYGVLKPYLNGLGLSLFLAAAAAIGDRLVRLRGGLDRETAVPTLLIGPALAGFVGVFLLAGEAATRHLLPTYPFIVCLLGGALTAWRDRAPQVGRAIAVVVLLTTAVYAGWGLLMFADEPRDSATATLATDFGADAEVVVYENSITDVAADHGRELQRYGFDEANDTGPLVRNETAFTEWMVETPSRQPDAIQLTCSGAIGNLHRPGSERFPERADYVRGLLFENATDYRVTDTFGTAPRTYLDRQRAAPLQRLFLAGVIPQPGTVEPCVVLLDRRG